MVNCNLCGCDFDGPHAMDPSGECIHESMTECVQALQDVRDKLTNYAANVFEVHYVEQEARIATLERDLAAAQAGFAATLEAEVADSAKAAEMFAHAGSKGSKTFHPTSGTHGDEPRNPYRSKHDPTREDAWDEGYGTAHEHYCAQLAAAQAEVVELAKFAARCWDEARDGCEPDGGDLQLWLVDCGYLVAHERANFCGEGCRCAEYHDGTGTWTCYEPRPAGDRSALEAVLKECVSECAMTMRSRCNCTHCDENAPGWTSAAIVSRILGKEAARG